MKIETELAQAGLDRDEIFGAISAPVYFSATFRHPGLGKSTGFDYTRTENPTRKALEKMLASLEKGDRGFAFASGMAAIAAVAGMLSPGDRIVLSDDLYGGTFRLFEKILKNQGIESCYCDSSDIREVEKCITAKTKAIFIETPSNPMMKITDIAAVSKIAKAGKMLLIVDNTFMTPYLQRPLELGADIVVHSGTKYLGGHNDALCGIVITADQSHSDQIAFIQNATGGVLSPFDSWLLLRGIKTLALRMERSENNAVRIVKELSGMKDVTEIFYPGVPSGKGYDIQKRQAGGFGAMISFRVKERALAENVINKVRLINFAESLGGVESLITYPLIQTHSDIPPEIRERLGITDTLLRLSVGIENCEDLITDLKNALGA